MNDTTRRFLTAIVDRVPAGGEIVELRLFPAIRQGGIESGVAVVAVQLPEVAPAETVEPDGSELDEQSGDVETAPPAIARPALEVIPPAVQDLVDTDVAVEDEEGGDGDEHPVPLSFVPMADTTGEHAVADALDEELTEIVIAAERGVVAASERPVQSSGEFADESSERAGSGELESPYADASAPALDAGRPIPTVDGEGTAAGMADLAARGDEPAIPLADILALPSPTPADAEDEGDAPPAARQRYAILTAHYRLTIKGPDRGKWDVEITHEADAPLETVERVARGVAKRAGEVSDPEHFSGESLRVALEAPVWATTP